MSALVSDGSGSGKVKPQFYVDNLKFVSPVAGTPHDSAPTTNKYIMADGKAAAPFNCVRLSTCPTTGHEMRGRLFQTKRSLKSGVGKRDLLDATFRNRASTLCVKRFGKFLIYW